MIVLLITITFSLRSNAAGLSESFASASNQSNTSTTITDNITQTDLVSSETIVSSTNFENSTITLTATKIGAEESNYIWTSDGRNNPILNLRPNTNYEFTVNTLPEDDSEHELKITTKQSEEIAEGEGVDEGESSNFIFNSGQPGTLSYFCEYHPTSMIGTINVVELLSKSG